MDAYLFRSLEWGHEVEFLYFYRHDYGAFCGYEAVEEDIGNQHICRGRGYLTWVVDSVSADCESCPVLFFYIWPHTADEFPVCHVFIAIVWNVLPSD